MKWAAFFFFSPFENRLFPLCPTAGPVAVFFHRPTGRCRSRAVGTKRIDGNARDPPGQFAGRFFESSKVFHAAPPSAAPPRHRSRGRQHIHDDSFQSSLLHCQANGPRVRSIVGTSTPRRSHRWRWMALPSLWENEEQLTPGRSARWNLGPVCPLSDAAQH
jgi:hypothetical protein